MLWEARKGVAQGQHQVIKSELLLTFLVAEWHPAKIHWMTLFLNRELLNTVTAVCYSPDGNRIALMTSNGLEIIDSATQRRTVILPVTHLQNRQFRTGGLSWLKGQDKLVLSLFNMQNSKYEIWVVTSNGNSTEVIYSHHEKYGRIIIMPDIIQTDQNIQK